MMPPTYRVIIMPAAIDDLRAIHECVSRSSPQNATSLLQDLFNAIDRLD